MIIVCYMRPRFNDCHKTSVTKIELQIRLLSSICHTVKVNGTFKNLLVLQVQKTQHSQETKLKGQV